MRRRTCLGFWILHAGCWDVFDHEIPYQALFFFKCFFCGPINDANDFVYLELDARCSQTVGPLFPQPCEGHLCCMNLAPTFRPSTWAIPWLTSSRNILRKAVRASYIFACVWTSQSGVPSTPLPSTKGNKLFKTPTQILPVCSHFICSLACSVFVLLKTLACLLPCTSVFFDTSISQHLSYSSMTMRSGPTMAATRLFCIEKSFRTKRRRRTSQISAQIEKEEQNELSSTNGSYIRFRDDWQPNCALASTNGKAIFFPPTNDLEVVLLASSGCHLETGGQLQSKPHFGKSKVNLQWWISERNGVCICAPVANARKLAIILVKLKQARAMRAFKQNLFENDG